MLLNELYAKGTEGLLTERRSLVFLARAVVYTFNDGS